MYLGDAALFLSLVQKAGIKNQLFLCETMNSGVDQCLQFLGVPTNIGVFFVDNKGWKPKESMTDLHPKPQRRLGINYPNLEAMAI